MEPPATSERRVSRATALLLLLVACSIAAAAIFLVAPNGVVSPVRVVAAAAKNSAESEDGSEGAILPRDWDSTTLEGTGGQVDQGDPPSTTGRRGPPAMEAVAGGRFTAPRVWKWLTFDAPGPQFGLSNQLITLYQAAHVAALSGRALVLPPSPASSASAIDFIQLVNVTETSRLWSASPPPPSLGSSRFIPIVVAERFDDYGRPRLTVASANSFDGQLDPALPEKSRRKYPRLALPSRLAVIKQPAAANRLLLQGLARHSASSGLRLSTVMWHVPFLSPKAAAEAAAEDPSSKGNVAEAPRSLTTLTESWFLSRIVLHRSIDRAANRLWQAAAARVAPVPLRLAVLHLRLEPDALGMPSGSRIRFSLPTAARFAAWLRECNVSSLFRQRAASSGPRHTAPSGGSLVYVMAGAGLAAAFVEELRNVLAWDGVPVVTKYDLLADELTASWTEAALRRPGAIERVLELPTVDADSVTPGAKVTNHFLAGVDLRLADRAEALLLPDFSTLTRAIQLRHCGNNGESAVIATYDKQFLSVTRRTCRVPHEQPHPSVHALSSTPYANCPDYDEAALSRCASRHE